jgi:hypothetical protein
VALRADPQQLPVRGDQLRTDQVVAGQGVPAGEPAGPATEREPGDPGSGHHAQGSGQAVPLGRPVEVAEQQPGTGPRGPAVRFDVQLAQRGQVEHQATVAGGVAGDVVPAAAHRQRQVVPPRVPDTAGDVARVVAAQHGQRPSVDHPVEHGAGRVVAGSSGRSTSPVRSRVGVAMACSR